MAVVQNLWNFPERKVTNLPDLDLEPGLHQPQLGDGGQPEHVRWTGLGRLHAKHTVRPGHTTIQIQQVSGPW